MGWWSARCAECAGSRVRPRYAIRFYMYSCVCLCRVVAKSARARAATLMRPAVRRLFDDDEAQSATEERTRAHSHTHAVRNVCARERSIVNLVEKIIIEFRKEPATSWACTRKGDAVFVRDGVMVECGGWTGRARTRRPATAVWSGEHILVYSAVYNINIHIPICINAIFTLLDLCVWGRNLIFFAMAHWHDWWFFRHSGRGSDAHLMMAVFCVCMWSLYKSTKISLGKPRVQYIYPSRMR